MARWTVLKISSRNYAKPTLFARLDVVRPGYVLHVTDLVYLWTESMDKRAIIRRAMDENTSIDPTDGPDQLGQLLHYIEVAMNGESHTSVRLGKDSDERSLKLKLTVDLPHPLASLVWPMRLDKAAQSVLSSELTIPAIQSLGREKAAVSSLLSNLRERDAVISKLLDRIEASGVELSAIFPAAASTRGTKGANRDLVFRSVPGLKRFQQDAWRRSLEASAESDSQRLFEEAFSEGFQSSSPVDLKTGRSWWNDLHDEDGDPRNFIPDSQPVDSYSLAKRNNERILSSMGKVAKYPAILDSRMADTASEATNQSGEAAKEQSNSTPVNKPEERQVESPRRRIGKLGGVKQATVSPVPNPESVHSFSKADGPVADARPIQPASPVKPRTGRLGRIGGAKPVPSTNPPHTTDVALPAVPLPSWMPEEKDITKERKVSEREARPEERDTESKQRERESSLERANRLRAELRRDLEEKKRAPPKKKRKF